MMLVGLFADTQEPRSYVWDANGEAVGQPLKGHTDIVRCVAVSKDGTRIVPGSDNGTVHIWDAQTGILVGDPLQVHTDWVRRVAVSDDGSRIVSDDGELQRLWVLDASAGAKCVLTSREAAWKQTVDGISLSWSSNGDELPGSHEVSDRGEKDVRIELSSCDKAVQNFNDGAVSFSQTFSGSSTVLR